MTYHFHVINIFTQKLNALNLYDGCCFHWLGDTGEDFEQGALSRSIATNDADDFAAFDYEGNVSQGPNGVVADDR
jgi:hypothetical protein